MGQGTWNTCLRIVVFEPVLLRKRAEYLEADGEPVINSNVGGGIALPVRIDDPCPHFGHLTADWLGVRTVYMTSALWLDS